MSAIFLITQEIGIEISLINDRNTTWTADSSRYYYNFNGRRTFDGKRRRIMSVNFAGSEMIEAASYQDCNGVDNSYWDDPANDRLYINPPASTAPNTRIIMPRFRMRWSNFAIDYDGFPFEPRILSNPEAMNAEEQVDGELMSQTSIVAGSYMVANGSARFDSYTIDDLLKNYQLLGQMTEKAKLVDGVKTEITSGFIGEWQRSDTKTKFIIRQ